jgi:hypothetical protein
MYVIFVLALVLIACLFFLLDRALKALQRGRRRRVAGERLLAVAKRAEKEHKQHKAHHEQATALTSVLPAILTGEDRGPRKVALFFWICGSPQRRKATLADREGLRAFRQMPTSAEDSRASATRR